MEQNKKIITIGRKPSNNIVIPNTDISGDHAKLTLLDETKQRWLLEDLNSKGGTKVNGNQVLRREVSPADSIVLGNTPIDWSLILKQSTKPLETPFLPKNTTISESSSPEEIAQKLANIYQEYIQKREKLDKLKESKETNAANRLLGGVVAGALGGVFFLIPEFKQFSALGGIIPCVIFGYTIYNSRKINKAIREVEPLSGALQEWYRSNFVCPKCYSPINDTYQTLLNVKICRNPNCKNRLIP